MKILFINKYFHYKGGSETVFFLERNHFKAKPEVSIVDFSMMDKANLHSDYSEFFADFVTFEDSASKKEKLGAALKYVHNREAIAKLTALISAERPDIAHLHNIYHQLTPSIIPILKKAGVKIVLTLHDYKLVCPNYLMLNKGQLCSKCQSGSFYHSIWERCVDDSFFKSSLASAEAYFHKFRKNYELVDAFIAPSRFLAALIARRFPQHNILFIPNGIDHTKYTRDCPDDGYILYIGRLSQEKGIETLLRAYSRSQGLPELKIAGIGPLYQQLKQKYESNKIHFLGHLPTRELHDTLKRAAYLVVPSEWYENCSMAVLEAMGYGKAVLASDIGGLPEQIENEKTGLLFAPGDYRSLTDKMTMLSVHSELRKVLGKNGRKKLENEYTLSMHIDQLERLYNQLLSPLK